MTYERMTVASSAVNLSASLHKYDNTEWRLVSITQANGRTVYDVVFEREVASPEEPKVKASYSNRGFAQFEAVPSTYEGDVRVYESSAAEEACIWLSTVSPKILSEPDGEQSRAVVHLTLANAAVLRDQLTSLISDHYLS